MLKKIKPKVAAPLGNQTDKPKIEAPISIIKYDHPKILVLDLGKSAQEALQAHGFNVSIGSFGTPYSTKINDSFVPVIVNGDTPHNTGEQEIIIVDLEPNDPLSGPIGEKQTSQGSNDWWVPSSDGFVDPRPRRMAQLHSAFDKIYIHGGIFIVFASPRQNQKAVFARVEQHYGFTTAFEIKFGNWSFLSVLSPTWIETQREYGEEISVIDSDGTIVHIINKHLQGANFDCTLSTNYSKERFIPLARNKYGATVAAILQTDEAKGLIIILPNIRDKGSLLVELLDYALPNIAPKLFTHVQNLSWASQAVYEFPEIIELQTEIEQVAAAAKEKVADLEVRIEKEREARQYIIGLLSSSGSELVSAVKKALEVLGFTNVVDVDELEGATTDGFLLEDLRIEDRSPTLLVEIKGVNGKPSDDDSMQVHKNVVHRMQEWERLDICGLTIINYEKNLPPLERDNKTPFRKLILTNAKQGRFGLMTSWDLSRLIRSFLKNGWSPANVRPIFYRIGRIEPVPEHYEYVGQTQDYWEKIGVVSILIDNATVSLGDRISFELPIDFEEQNVASMQVNQQPIEKATIGMVIAVSTFLTKEQARKGIRVFRVKTQG